MITRSNDDISRIYLQAQLSETTEKIVSKFDMYVNDIARQFESEGYKDIKEALILLSVALYEKSSNMEPVK